jgi:hypothetical protein
MWKGKEMEKYMVRPLQARKDRRWGRERERETETEREKEREKKREKMWRYKGIPTKKKTKFFAHLVFGSQNSKVSPHPDFHWTLNMARHHTNDYFM